MKSRLVRIGNSRGVRLPKALIDEAGLEDEVEIRAEGRSIVITPTARVREGWAQDAAKGAAKDAAKGAAKGAAKAAKAGEHRLLDPPTPTRFDAEEWEW